MISEEKDNFTFLSIVVRLFFSVKSRTLNNTACQVLEKAHLKSDVILDHLELLFPPALLIPFVQVHSEMYWPSVGMTDLGKVHFDTFILKIVDHRYVTMFKKTLFSSILITP